MKILQVNNVYGEKSTGKITQILHEGLKAAGFESVVVFGRGHGAEEEGIIRLCPELYAKLNALRARITGIPYGGCFLSTARLKRIISREKPDVVHLQCINGYFVNIFEIVRWLKNKGVKTVVSLHAEFMYTANCGHAFECDQWEHGCQKCPNPRKAVKSWFFDCTGRSWKKMKKAFEGFEKDCVAVAVSPWTEERARRSDILKGFRVCTIYPGVDLSVFYGSSAEEKQPDTVFHATAHFSVAKDHEKGGWYLAELARRMPDVRFLVAGRADSARDIPDNLILLGEIRDQNKLAELYRQAALSVLVSRRETFSMVCAESLCCGTPVVGFMAGGPERIALKEYSHFAEQGDLAGLEASVRRWLEKEYDPQRVAAEAKEVYSEACMINRFIKLYGEMTSG